MDQAPSASLRDHVATLTAPRRDQTKQHHRLAIITMARGGVIGGAERWGESEPFGHAKLAWRRPFLTLPHGMPSHDTVGRGGAARDAAPVPPCCLGWVQAVVARTAGPRTPGHGVALDGKTVRRSHDRGHGTAAIHLGSAWAAANRLVLGQITGEDTANAITALPALVQVLAVPGGIVTIAALGCQTASAEASSDQGADYVRALPGNHPALEQAVQALVSEAQATRCRAIAHDQQEPGEKGHGRSEVCRWWTMREPASLASLNAAGRWPRLRRLGMSEAARTLGGTTSRAARYGISSLAGAAQPCAPAVRQHWGIENGRHWVLDMAFREDDCRVRQGEAAQTFAVRRQVARHLLRQERTATIGGKAKRLKAGWDEQYLRKVLQP